MTITIAHPDATTNAAADQPADQSGDLQALRRGIRVEAHPHRPKVKAGATRALSVRPLPNGHVAYVSHLILNDAQFVVQEGGHARAAREQVRNVHAWVRGSITQILADEDPHSIAHQSLLYFAAEATGEMDGGWVPVVYNPFLSNTFRRRDEDPYTGETSLGPTVLAARYVAMHGAQCWAFDPTYATV